MPWRVDLALCTQAQAGPVSFPSLLSLKILYLQMCGMLAEWLQADPSGYALKEQLTVSPLNH